MELRKFGPELVALWVNGSFLMLTQRQLSDLCEAIGLIQNPKVEAVDTNTMGCFGQGPGVQWREDTENER